MVGLRRQRAVQADEVRRAQQFLQPDVPHQALQRRVAVLVIGQNGHTEAAADAGHGRADAPGAHDASGGAVQRVTQQAVQRKVVVAHLDVGFADAAVGGHGQRHGVFGHGLGAVTGHPQHCDAAALGGVQVHVIEPGAAKQQQFYPDGSQRFQHRGRTVGVDERAHRLAPGRQGCGVLVQISCQKADVAPIFRISSQYVKV